MHLDAVHINGVLIKGTSTHVILTTQFVGLTHTGKSDQETLDTSACCVRHKTGRRRIYLIHCALRVLDTAHLDLRQQLFVSQQLHVDIEHVTQVDDSLLHARVSDHREGQHHRIRFVQQQFVIAVLVRCSTDRPIGIQYYHVRQLNTHVILVHDVAVHTCIARVQRNRA